MVSAPMSFNAAALKLMADKGLSAHDVAEIAAAAETRSSGASRQARYRARKRGGDVTGDVTPLRNPAPNERDNLTPTREKPKPIGLVKNTGKGFRLPADWQPATLTGKAATMVATWQSGAMERELAKFKNYWLAKGANAARTDWQRTWVNWLISADERKPRGTYERSDRDPTTVAVERFLSGDVGTHAGTG
jgi:hypothetical protein